MNTLSTSSLLILKGLEGNTPMTLDPLQKFLSVHIEEMTTLWWVIWCSTLLFLVARHIVLPLFNNRSGNKKDPH